MPYKGFKTVTLPEEVVDDAKEVLENNKERLKKIGIKKVSHVFERAWYHYKDVLQNSP